MAITRMLPDAEALTITYLRDQPDVAALIGGRVYGSLPQEKTWPLVRVVRIGGEETFALGPLEHEQAVLQVDAWGGTKSQARLVVETVRAALALPDFIDVEGIHGVMTVATPQYLPDTDFDPPKARYTYDQGVYVRALPVAPS